MSSSFPDSFIQPGDDSIPVASSRPFDDGYLGYDPRLPSQRFDSFSNFAESESVKDSVGDSPIFHSNSYSAGDDVFTSHSIPETPSPPPIYGSGGGFVSDPHQFSSFSPEANGKGFDGGFGGSDGPILPPPSELEPEEGFARREWRRQNAIQLEEKEKREKELLSQIIHEADEFKVEFYRKRQITCENNKATNREKEKLFVASRDKFHAEADKNYWKAIAELVPKEVPAIEKKRGKKKEQDNKPSIVVIQGPKPGKPTDCSRMRQILLKLKHNTPAHLKPSPPPPPAAAAATAPTKDGAKTGGPAVVTAPSKAADVVAPAVAVA